MTTDQIAGVLQSLADKFGVTVAYLWPRLVAYTFWVNAANVLIEVIVILVAAVFISRCFSRVRVADDAGEMEFLGALAVGVGLVLLALLALVAIISLPANIAGVMAPEGKALYDLFAAFGGKRP